MKEHKEMLYSVLPIVILIIAVVLHLSFGNICDEDNYTGLEVFQQKIVKNSSELCVIPITPTLFKWVKNPETLFQIEYNARISHHPDLPSWLHYTYDEVRSEGFLYGVPPKTIDSINLNVVGWNRDDEYNVRKLIISLDIVQPTPVSRPGNDFVVELKIDNMNARDLCRPRRMDKVIAVFTKYMNWMKLNDEPVRPVYLASAVDLGENRVPLRPSESEGVILHLASDRNFSLELFKLQSEVSPLWKLRPCPRDVKRTSMERYFRSENVLLDWCSFRLVTNSKDSQPIQSNLETNDNESSAELVINPSSEDPLKEAFYFTDEIPQKSYLTGIILATIIPGSIGSILGFILLVLFWQDREEESPVDGDSLFFEAAFRFLVTLFSRCRTEDVDEDSSADNNNPIRNQYHGSLYKSPTGDDNVILITRDRYNEPPKELNDGSIMDDGRERTPLPPQYGDRELHPNGSPALIYAV